MENLKQYVRNHSVPLFKTTVNNSLEAIFDRKGFWFSDEALREYANIKNQPHLYVAYTEDPNGFYYIGKSFQKGGRWKRSHAYHLGTLAHQIYNTIRKDDQNHQHWIDNWMDQSLLSQYDNFNTIGLKQKIFICFIPFYRYHAISHLLLPDNIVRSINSQTEVSLTLSYLHDGYTLLNKQNNKFAKAIKS